MNAFTTRFAMLVLVTSACGVDTNTEVREQRTTTGPPDFSFVGQSSGGGSFSVISASEGRFAGEGHGAVSPVDAEAYAFSSSSVDVTLRGRGSLSSGVLEGSVSGALVGDFAGSYTRGSDGKIYGGVGFSNLKASVLESIGDAPPTVKLVDASASSSFTVGISLQSPQGGSFSFTGKLSGTPSVCAACAKAGSEPTRVLPERCRCARGPEAACDWLWKNFIDVSGPNAVGATCLVDAFSWICPLGATEAEVIATQCDVDGTAMDKIECLMGKLAGAVPGAKGGWWDDPDDNGWVCRHYAQCFEDLARSPFLGGFPGASTPTGSNQASYSGCAGHAFNHIKLDNGSSFYADAYNGILIACNAGS